MWILKQVLLGVGAFSFGLIVAGGFLAFISMIGVIPRLAAVTKTAKQTVLYENSLIYGAILGNLFSLYERQVPIGAAVLIFPGLFGGIFVGALAGALAEVVNVIPIFTRRLRLRKGIPFLVYALALGKGIGSLIQFFLLYHVQ
ncbi:MAG: stage V sporulation protein AB [Lachnospiraceae bacterium]|nr:stage V sporulation protein AB [Lachnospiraceae bacterium]